MSINRYKDEQGRRHYTDGTRDVLSVTTVLNLLEEDDTGLKIWKRRNNGKGDNAHHEHLFKYKTYRGTLCHYQALVAFEEVFEDGEDMWGPEEMKAMMYMMDNDTDFDFVYSILKDHGFVSSRAEFEDRYVAKHCSRCEQQVSTLGKNCPFCGCFLKRRLTKTLTELNRMDVDWFVEAFADICEKLGINSESIIRVERFMLNDDYGYGGQCDLIYRDPDGKVVVADLKTSSGLRHKHRLQAVAYAKAAEQDSEIEFDTVDRVEVIRIHPDSQTWEVHANEAPTEYHTDEGWFKDPWGNFEYDSLEEMWETFVELTELAKQ